MPSPLPSSARSTNLLRLIHAVAHDLSNPLQALMLHATLALEDTVAGSEEASRHEADVCAIRRMSQLLRAVQGLAAAAEGRRPVGSMLSRFVDLLGPRFERVGVACEALPAAAALGDVSATTEEALLGLGLALALELRRDRAQITVVRIAAELADQGAALRLPLTFAAPEPSAATALAARFARSFASEAVAIDRRLTVEAHGPSVVLSITRGTESAP